MPLTLIAGPANAGKAALVLDALRIEARRGGGPWLVVPTGADARHYRRELAAGGVVMGVRVTHFGELLHEMARRAGVAEEPIAELARERLLAALARSSRSGTGERNPAAGDARELARLVAELQSRHVGPQALCGALAAWAGAERRLRGELAEVAAVLERYQELLLAIGRSDAELLGARATDALRERPGRWAHTPVFFYGFDDLTPLEQDAIETLAVVVDAPVTVALSYEPGRVAFAARAGAFQTLAPWAADRQVLGPAAEHYALRARPVLSHLERNLFEDGADPVDPGGVVRLLEGPSERAELELVATEIGGLLEAGMAPSEIAVVHRSPDTIADTLRAICGDREVPLDCRHRARFGGTALGSGLIAVVRCALLDGDERDLLRWLRTPGVVRVAGFVDAFEVQLRWAGVKGLEAARALWEAEHWPLSAIDRLRASAASGPAALLACLERELWGIFDRPRAGSGVPVAEEERDEASALAGALGALASLRELVEGLVGREGDVAESLCSATGLVRGLEELRLERPATSREEAVALVDPLALRARRVRALFLCGLQEGVFPQPPGAAAYFDDEERRVLAERSGLLLRHGEDALGSERYLFYACVSRPEEQLVLSWHAADDDGNMRPRSLFVDDVCDLFSARLEADCARPQPVGRWARDFAGQGRGPDGGTVVGPAAASGCALGGVEGGWPGAWSAAVLGGGNGTRAGSGAELADGAAESQLVRELAAEGLWSASSLEAWACCPMRWFVERLLRPAEIDPESEPLIAGTVIHEVLRAVHQGLKDETGSARLVPERLERAEALMLEALAAQCSQVTLASSPERSAGVRRRLEADLGRYLERAAEAASEFEPQFLELEFGFEGESGEGRGALDLGDGIELRGRIDRIDVDPQGRALVYDYKRRFRAAQPGAKWAASRNLQVALYMRAVEEMLDCDVVGGLYQPVTGEELRARGAVSDEVSLASVRTDRYDRDALRSLVEEAVSVAREAGREAAAGRLEARPETCSSGEWGCRYPTICRCGHGNS